jgi:putative endonuclease
MASFMYIYTLQSEADPSRFYSGCTRDLRKRLTRHNSGEGAAHLKMEAVAAQDLHCLFGQRAYKDVRALLKTASGRAFAKKRL